VKVRIIPGPEKDEVVTTDNARALRKRTRVYAWPGQDNFDLGKETEKHLSKYWRFNQYDYRDVNYDYGLWLPNIGFNIDDGLRLGLSYQEHYYTFHRHFKQSIGGLYATSSKGLQVKYNFGIIDLAPRLDLNFDGVYQTPNYAINFFGFGNETVESTGERRFYRIRQEVIRFAPSLFLRNKNHDGGLRFTLMGEAILAGFPRDGMSFSVDGILRRRTTPEPATIPSFESSLTVYQHLWQGAALVSRVGFGITSGDYYFYDAQQLGAGTLRGYRRERFIGDRRFFNNIDLRQEFAKKAFKSRIGVFASFDHGRVWYEPSANLPESKIWHSSYGGGVFLRPLSLFTLSTGYYVPEDGSDPVIRIVAGFDF